MALTNACSPPGTSVANGSESDALMREAHEPASEARQLEPSK